MTDNRVCGSGAQAIASAAQEIMLGMMDSAVAGGMENMDQAPYEDGLSREIPAARLWSALLVAVPVALALLLQINGLWRPDIVVVIALPSSDCRLLSTRGCTPT